MRWIAGGAALGLVACAAEVPEDTSESGTGGSPEVATGASAATATEAPAEDWPGYYAFDVAVGQDIHVSWGEGLLGYYGQRVPLPEATEHRTIVNFDPDSGIWEQVERGEPTEDMNLSTHVRRQELLREPWQNQETTLPADLLQADAPNLFDMTGGRDAVYIFLRPTTSASTVEIAL